ncbi:EamA family transporter [Salinarimonas ramus]|uniref:DMT transporter permease n=1 Tax=Salinarimonas ramus TaxID=690164 RepID=A0A917QHC0_9HYPH|nr:EamA family transporter [Salinarimonas ramus]GGK50399.1 DMT transporter permease [Salinarimonas ramus]
MDVTLLWIPVTLAAAVAQTGRNALQRDLTARIGTIGATQVRFLFGLPFAIVFLGIALVATGEALPRPGEGFFGFLLVGALAQIAATALMLAAMRDRAFSVVTAYLKTEPVLTALFAVTVIGDPITSPMMAAIAVATAGVVLVSHTPGKLTAGGLRPALLGLAAAAGFGLSAVGYRGAILAFEDGGYLVRATTALVAALALQTAILLVYLLVFDRKALLGSLREWRGSSTAGFLGALASQFWFLGFALTSAANVRTLALVEVVFAQMVSRRLFAQETSRRELLGIALIVAGVGALLWKSV